MFKQDDIFLVTGATSGIGKSVVLSLLNHGATVIAIGRSAQKLSLLNVETGSSTRLILEKKDLSSSDGLDKWVLSISKKF